MKNEKVNFIKEKELSKKADELFDDFMENGFSQNPIKAKYLAFKEVKKDISIKDLF